MQIKLFEQFIKDINEGQYGGVPFATDTADDIVDSITEKDFKFVIKEIEEPFKSYKKTSDVDDLDEAGYAIAGVWKWATLDKEQRKDFEESWEEDDRPGKPFLGTFRDLPRNLQNLVLEVNKAVVSHIEEYEDDVKNWNKFFTADMIKMMKK